MEDQSSKKAKRKSKQAKRQKEKQKQGQAGQLIKQAHMHVLAAGSSAPACMPACPGPLWWLGGLSLSLLSTYHTHTIMSTCIASMKKRRGGREKERAWDLTLGDTATCMPWHGSGMCLEW